MAFLDDLEKLPVPETPTGEETTTPQYKDEKVVPDNYVGVALNKKLGVEATPLAHGDDLERQEVSRQHF
jgi:hypothetical protein